MTQPTQAATLKRAGTLGFWRDLLLVLTLTVVGLVFGAGFLLPLTFAVLIFVLLTTVIDQIAQQEVAGWKVPRWLAHVLGILLIFAGVGVVVLILASQSEEVAAAIPRYVERFQGVLDGLVALIGQENAEVIAAAVGSIDASEWALGAVGTAGGFLSGLFLVLLYVPFLMAERAPMLKKVAIAAPDEETGRELHNLAASIAIGLQRYVGVKTFVSVLTGLFSYAVMKPLGLDFAETWAVLAFALNFIPSIGSILGVVCPAVVSLVQFDSLTPFLVIVFGCGTVQFCIGNILEPALTGRSLNISSFLVILSLTFWSAVWGVAGAFLSVPITVCILIIVSHVPSLRGLAVLMSGDGGLITDHGGGGATGQSAPPTAETRPQGE